MTPTRTRMQITATLFSLLRRALYVAARDRTAAVASLRTLVIAPHPDDETLGCGATIARVHAAGKPVRVVIVADGRASHDSSLIDADRLATIRAQEALEACARLGVAAEQVRLLAFPDGDLSGREPAIAVALRKEIEAFAPQQILYPSRLDRHDDHRAVADAVEAILASDGRGAKAYAYPVWFWNFGMWRAQAAPLRQLFGLRPVKVRTKGELELKRAALAAHRSQFENFTGDEGWQVLDSTFTRHFFGPFELFFEYRPSAAFAAATAAESPAPLTGRSASGLKVQPDAAGD